MTPNAVVILILGWLLGLLSHSVIEWNRSIRRADELRSSIALELDELKYRIAWGALAMFGRQQALDREVVDWFIGAVQEYKGVHAESKALSMLKEMTTLDDARLQAYLAKLARPGRGANLKQFHLPLLSAAIGELSILPAESQRLALDVLRQIGMLNEEIQLSNDNFQRTFDTSITGGNRAILDSNIQLGYMTIGKMSRWLVEGIGRFAASEAAHRRRRRFLGK